MTVRSRSIFAPQPLVQLQHPLAKSSEFTQLWIIDVIGVAFPLFLLASLTQVILLLRLGKEVFDLPRGSSGSIYFAGGEHVEGDGGGPGLFSRAQRFSCERFEVFGEASY